MLPKARGYAKSCGSETKWMNFFIKYDDLLKNVMMFGRKPVRALKNNSIVDPSTI